MVDASRTVNPTRPEWSLVSSGSNGEHRPSQVRSAGLFLFVGEGVVGTIAELFWNSEEGRLRAGWRVIVFWFGSIVFGIALFRLRDAVPSAILAEVYRNVAEAAIYLFLVWVVLLLLVGS